MTKRDILRQTATLNLQPHKVNDRLFRENDFFDPSDLLQVKYEMLRKVSQEGWDITRAAKTFGFTRPSFYKASAEYQTSGLIGLLPKKTGPKAPHKLTAAVVNYIKESVCRNSKLTAKELSQRVEKKFSLSIHPRSIERVLKSSKKKR